MKPRRTPLRANAATGSVQASNAPTPAANPGASASAALRERLTQTRARMARAQGRKAPQIDIDWDPEEVPTRRYEDELLMAPWLRLHQADTHKPSPQARGQGPSRTRLGSGEVPVGQAFEAPPDAPDAPDAPPRRRQRSGEVPVAAAAERESLDEIRPRERARSGEVPVAAAAERESLDEIRPRERARSGEVPVAAAAEQRESPGEIRPRERARSQEVPVAAAAEERESPGEIRPRERARSGEVPVAAAAEERESPDEIRPRERARSRSLSKEVPVAAAAERESLDEIRPRERARSRSRSQEVPIGTQFGEQMYVEPDASVALDPSTFSGAHQALDPSEFPGANPRRRVRDPIMTPLSVEAAPHIAPILERATRAPLATTLLREVSAVREHAQAWYARLDHSERALRNRVALCSGALLLLATASPLLWKSSPAAEPEPAKSRAAVIAPKALPRRASIAVSSDPAGAEIFVDGQASGKVTPASISELTPGKHVIGLQLAGYGQAKEALRVPEDALLAIKLAALSAPRGASQAIEGRTQTRAEARAEARAIARERRAAVRAARTISRYRARMGLETDPGAQEPVEAAH